MTRENVQGREAVCMKDMLSESKRVVQETAIPAGKYKEARVQDKELPQTFMGLELLPQSVMGIELGSLNKEVRVFSLVSHLVWSVWALHQATHSCGDFDYMKYAVLRHSLFIKYRERFACET